tara:strand:+ start:10344 stop:10616 length:273 start_codon:yes stop_codon:yes gene_type:complete
MINIIKRNGKMQRFSITKLQRAIDKAAKEVKVTTIKRKKLCKEIAKGVSDSLKKKRLISATDLRRRVLGRLESRSKATLKAWKRFDKKRH